MQMGQMRSADMDKRKICEAACGTLYNIVCVARIILVLFYFRYHAKTHNSCSGHSL